MIESRNPPPSCLDLNQGADAPFDAPSLIESLVRRINDLELRLNIQEEIVTECMQEGGARVVHSLGTMLHFFGEKGIIETGNAEMFMNGNYQIVNYSNNYLDIYQCALCIEGAMKSKNSSVNPLPNRHGAEIDYYALKAQDLGWRQLPDDRS